MVPSPKIRAQVEVWFRQGPGRPLAECLSDLEADGFLIHDTEIPTHGVGDSIIELGRLVLLLAPFNGRAGQPKEHDLIVVPGTPHVLLLFKYATYPPYGANLIAFGGHRYALDIGAFLTHGSYHPCYCSLPARTRVGVEVREPGPDFRKSDRLSK